MSDAENRALLRVDVADFAFSDRVFADVRRIRRTASGRALFGRLRDLRRTFTIEKPNPPVNPPNAWTLPRNASDGSAAELLIVYDPADWPCPAWPGCPASDVVLFGRLQDAVMLVAGADRSTQAAVSDTAPIDAYLRERTAVPGRLAASP